VCSYTDFKKKRISNMINDPVIWLQEIIQMWINVSHILRNDCGVVSSQIKHELRNCEIDFNWKPKHEDVCDKDAQKYQQWENITWKNTLFRPFRNNFENCWQYLDLTTCLRNWKLKPQWRSPGSPRQICMPKLVQHYADLWHLTLSQSWLGLLF
jgi:hypothetical protein